MPDRRRLAVVAAPLLGLLVAVLAGWSVAAAQASDPLTLTITAERSECTAATLNPVTWTITGGTPPYTLTIDGAPVEADAESTTVTCGGLPEGASTAPGTITGVVSDANGATATASAAYTIVPPLPAPANFRVGVHPGFVLSYWDQVRGAHSQYPELDESQVTPAEWDTRGARGYLVRYRTDAASTWTYAEASDAEWTTLGGYLSPWETPPPGTFYTAAIAAARHPLELETPEALNWGAPIRYTTSGPAQNLTVRATHNGVTVTWSKQPGTQQAWAYIENPRGGGETRYVAEGDEPGTHTVTFNHLEPDSEYKIWILQFLDDHRGAVSRSFRTAAAPPGWQPLPRGPQNLRATATHDTITVTWDPPFEGASPRWFAAMLDGEIMVHTFQTNAGETTWVSSGEVDSIGRYRILPDTTYTIILTHVGIHRARQTITVTTQAAPPLRLALTAERSECTAGTLNPITWEISGGTPPYTLTIDGGSVDPGAESATVTCGALPDGAVEAPGTITAVVTGANGATATASAAYTIVPPLPAPTGLRHTPYPGSVETWWDGVPGVAKLTLEDAEGAPYTIDAYLVRYRAVGAAEWSYAPGKRTLHDVWEVFDAGIREFSVAALRHPLERLTPAALRWSAAHPYAPVVEPQNVVATATHDTVTVRWDKQPHGTDGMVALFADGGVVAKRFPTATSAGRHSITFSDVPPSASYDVLVVYDGAPEMPGTSAWTEVTTLAAPPDYEPPPSGPQNLRATATQHSITVSWEASRPAAPLSYEVQVFHAESGIRVAMRHPPDGVTSVTVIGNYWRIQPDTLYEVVVFEDGIRGTSAEISIRTPASPDQAGLPTCFEYLVGATICA